MIRTLYDYPGPVDFALLRLEVAEAVGNCLGANDVGGQVAVYTEGAPDEAAVAAVVAAHAGPMVPTPDPLHLLAQAIVEATTLADLVPVAEQILADGDT